MKQTKGTGAWTLVLMLLLAFAVGAEAQVTTATIYGRVEDPSGAIGGSYSRGVD